MIVGSCQAGILSAREPFVFIAPENDAGNTQLCESTPVLSPSAASLLSAEVTETTTQALKTTTERELLAPTKPDSDASKRSTPVIRSHSLSARALPEALRMGLSSSRVDPTMLSRLLDWRTRPAPVAPTTPGTTHTQPPAAPSSSKSPLFPRVTYPGSSGLTTGDASSVGAVFDLSTVFRSQVVQPSLVADIATVRAIRGVKTDIGLARAFVRLALEKKLLSAHLTRLLMDVKLLRRLYSRYAFLRCEEEREQFLVHLLSLNAVDYYSFTRMLPQADLIYQVFICTSRKHGFATTANMWIRLHGHLGSTRPIALPRGRNLITIRIDSSCVKQYVVFWGHDPMAPSFPCCRWIGRGIEDDALERILVGHLVRLAPNDPKLIFTAMASDPGDGVCKLPNRCQSPAAYRRSFDSQRVAGLFASELGLSLPTQSTPPSPKVGLDDPGSYATNSLPRPPRNRYPPGLGSFTPKMMHPSPSFSAVQGQSVREQLAWYLRRESERPGYAFSQPNSPSTSRLYSSPALYQLPPHEANMTTAAAYSAMQANRICVASMRQSLIDFVTHVQQVARLGATLGKEGRFQLLMCRGIREHLLVSWFSLLAVSPITSQMYESKSFFLNHDLRQAIQQLLAALDEFELPMESVLLREA
ncbi:unnamed protein product [Echinostoma caproni]|uniref:RUN domain-containing protein n=1 Tax=Echinostoma caproni TaxID=27848 RepID=A0A183AYS0_9TREM|nr:unnamed protein product [Echinostoma caproni]